jgi:2-methylcitrate dehydratase PrpD
LSTRAGPSRSVAAAATACLALGCDSWEQVAAAIELSLAYAGGLWSINRSRAPYKPLSPAIAAARGIIVARTALALGERVPGILADIRAYYRALPSAELPPGHGLLLNGYKFYPACRHTHTAVEAAERLSRVVEPARVVRVEVVVFEEAVRVAGKPWPTSLRETMFSLAYLVSVALTYGRLGFRELKMGMSDPRVKRLFEATRIVVEPSYTEAYPREQPATVRVVLGDTVVEETVRVPKGDPARKPSLRDLVLKAELLSREAADRRVLALAERIARLKHDEPLDGLLEAVARSEGFAG